MADEELRALREQVRSIKRTQDLTKARTALVAVFANGVADLLAPGWSDPRMVSVALDAWFKQAIYAARRLGIDMRKDFVAAFKLVRTAHHFWFVLQEAPGGMPRFPRARHRFLVAFAKLPSMDKAISALLAVLTIHKDYLVGNVEASSIKWQPIVDVASEATPSARRFLGLPPSNKASSAWIGSGSINSIKVNEPVDTASILMELMKAIKP